MEMELSFFSSLYKRVSRPKREHILCAMIRVNYGTPWKGDISLLKEFFPQWYHLRLAEGGLTNLVEGLSPFTDEPTEFGVVAQEEGTGFTKTVLDELTKTFHRDLKAPDQELTLLHDSTSMFKPSLTEELPTMKFTPSPWETCVTTQLEIE